MPFKFDRVQLKDDWYLTHKMVVTLIAFINKMPMTLIKGEVQTDKENVALVREEN